MDAGWSSGSPSQQVAAWHTVREDAFAEWSRETGTPGLWDFSPGSLDALESLVRDRISGEDQLEAARSDPFVQGAIWYLGEVACRARGLVWHYWPFATGGAPLPDLFASGEPGFVDTPAVGRPGAREDDGHDPMALIRMLYWSVDDIGRPVDTHLREILT